MAKLIIAIMICLIVISIVLYIKQQPTSLKDKANLKYFNEKTENEDEMVEIFKMMAISSGQKEEDINEDDLRLSWRMWGNGPHYDFPHECKKNTGGRCTCGHHH